MLFETLSQPLIALYLFGVGFLCGIIFDLNNLICMFAKTDKVLRFVLDIICTFLVFGIFFLLILNISFGEIRFYQILLFVLSIFLYRITFGKLFAKLIEKCYIKLIGLKNKIFKHFNQKRNKKVELKNKKLTL